MTAGIMFLAFLIDVVVWCKAHRIDIAPGDNSDQKSANTAAECEKSLPNPDTSV